MFEGGAVEICLEGKESWYKYATLIWNILCWYFEVKFSLILIIVQCAWKYQMK